MPVSGMGLRGDEGEAEGGEAGIVFARGRRTCCRRGVTERLDDSDGKEGMVGTDAIGAVGLAGGAVEG